MKKTLLISLCLVLCVSLAASLVIAKDTAGRYSTYKAHQALENVPYQGDFNQLRASAAADTAFLAAYTFNSGATCLTEGWTAVDVTAQLDSYWHVADGTELDFGNFGGLRIIEGSQSLWLGVDASLAVPYCGYSALPGYGNGWNQSFCTLDCQPTGLGATLAMKTIWDSEPGYDVTTLQIADCAVDENAWEDLYGGIGVWDGVGSDTLVIAIPDTIPNGTAAHGSIKLRFNFVSDGGWSDEDGLWNTDGAQIIDDLLLTGTTLEDFEGEAPGATVTTDGVWGDCTDIGYGDFTGLYQALSLVIEDPCASNVSCVWAWFDDSANYGCGGFPLQNSVPYENARGQYINNEIWSPLITNSGAGSVYELAFDVYRDLPLNALVFYVWHIRSYVAGCPSGWADRGFVYFGPDKDWLRSVFPVGDLVDPAAEDLQVALGVVDMCAFWCNIYGDGTCHTHTPLIDNFDVYRINTSGPQWSGRDIDMFQDTFPDDGTTTGTAAIDMAQDIRANEDPVIEPGDSTTVTVSDQVDGLAAVAGGSAVYCVVNVAGPSAAAITATPSLLTDDAIRWPVDPTPISAGWYQIRMDTVKTANGSVVEDRFCIDLNDALFLPGDVISFFFKATNDGAPQVTTYYSVPLGPSTTLSEAIAGADEVSILPNYGLGTGDVLYVEGMNFRGAQQYFDSAFDQLGILGEVDRYDLRGPSSGVANRPGSRVKDVDQQLIGLSGGIYKKIIWNTGNLTSGLIGDGIGLGIEKSDDAQMLLTFLDNLQSVGGLYLNGDNISEDWTSIHPATVSLRGYITHNLTNGDHVAAGFGFSPLVIGSGTAFVHNPVPGPDKMIAYGGCAGINNFDVLEPTGTAVSEMVYQGGSPATESAVISQTTLNTLNNSVSVVLSGFSFHYIRDDTTGTGLDRTHHMKDILEFLGNIVGEPTPATPTLATSLSQNYPNPFNPTTTIDFTVKELAPVSVKIYNVSGQLVKTLVNDRFEAGVTHQVSWDGRNDTGQSVSSGVYFYKLVTKNFTQTKKMVLLK